MKNNIALAFWLIPAQDDKVFFQEIIDNLAKEYDAATFIPHVTIYFGQYTPDTSASELIEKAIQGIQGFSLKVESLLYTEEFTKTVFVQFHPSTVLSQISESLASRAINPSNFILNPHLSLIYKHMDEESKKNLTNSITLPRQEIFFDEVIAISGPDKIRGREDIESLEIICTKKFSS